MERRRRLIWRRQALNRSAKLAAAFVSSKSRCSDRRKDLHHFLRARTGANMSHLFSLRNWCAHNTQLRWRGKKAKQKLGNLLHNSSSISTSRLSPLFSWYGCPFGAEFSPKCTLRLFKYYQFTLLQNGITVTMELWHVFSRRTRQKARLLVQGSRFFPKVNRFHVQCV